MDILSIIQSQMGGDVLNQIAQQTGADPAAVQQAMPSVVSSLLGGLANNAQQPEGAMGILNALGNHNGSILDNLAGAVSNADVQQDGQKIAGHIFGGQQEQVANAIGGANSLNSNQVMQLISIAAPIVMGVLGQQNQQQSQMGGGGGFDLGSLASILMGGAQQAQQQSGFGGMGGGLGAMLGGLLDQDKDGNVVDDVMGMLGKMMK